MAINKERNVRFNITISKKQYTWLRDFSKKKHLRISQLISWLLAKKTKDVIDTLNLNTQPIEEVNKLEEEENDQIIEKDIEECKKVTWEEYKKAIPNATRDEFKRFKENLN